MNTVIELLLENIVFVIAIGGFLYSLYVKNVRNSRRGIETPVAGSDEDRPESSPVQRMPSFGGEDGSLTGRVLTKAYRNQSTSVDGTSTPVYRSYSLDTTTETEGISMERFNELPSEVTRFEQVKHVSSPSKSDREAVLNSLDAGRKSVVQGVVWAEILGPPRAKKPWRRDRG
ncbi:hypothetical protein SY83_14750 [Paenibacillus swuensis]|uniref:Uncharacterized protein n=1 Tax=Paenibacillus swuensis TaxID=1178515 RepID=A0A172TK16_9BACL|nr:hypothetical protein [Paenibacillus swuensis]ANE47316.1 hypothetical protein SY83_14750 [Paenibacillus swuensis]